MELARFLEPIREHDLRDVYTINHAELRDCLASLRNDSTTVEFSEVNEHTNDGNRVRYSVNLYLDSGSVIFDKAMERWLSDNKRSLERPEVRAKVAFRVKFYCRSPFKGA